MKREEYIQFLRLVVHTAKLDSLTANQIDEMSGTYRGAIDALIKNVFADPDADPDDRGRAIRLMQQFTQGLDVVSVKAKNDIADFTAKMGYFSFEEINNMVSWDGLVKDFNEVLPSLDDVRAGVLTTEVAGNNLNGWIDNIFTNSQAAIRQEINAGRVAGLAYPEIAARIRKDLKKSAYKTVNGKAVPLDPENELITITRSYVQQSNVNAQTAVYAANSDIVDKVKWISTLENGSMSTGRGTCPRCAALDGNVYDMGPDGQPVRGPRCTLHPRCRCVLVPQTKSWRDLGFDVDEMEEVYRPWVERTEDSIALGGRRDILDVGRTNKNYSEMFKGKAPEFQDALVGPRRAEMIRQDYFDLADVVDDMGNMIPIETLRVKYKIPGKGRGGIPPADVPVIMPKPLPVAETIAAAPTPDQVDEVFRSVISNEDYRANRNRLLELEREYNENFRLYKRKERAYEEYRDIYQAIDEETIALKKRRKQFDRELFVDPLRPPKGGKIDLEVQRQGSRLYSKNLATWDTIRQECADMWHPDILETVPTHRLSIKTGDRAYHTGKQIHMGGAETDVFIHEFGHAVETYLSGTYNKTSAFLSKRAAGETKTAIYRGEYGYKDNFFSHYCGRVYPFKATEILSMGVQRMYNDPMGFYLSDPEYFQLVLEIMWGKLD